MRSLRTTLARLRGQRDRGAVATIVGIFLAGGVVIGMLAVSVDLGNIMYERRQVQNGADATSMALAQECAADANNCDSSLAEDLLGANARDAASQYSSRTDLLNGACARGDSTQVGPLAGVDCASAGGGGDIADLAQCPPLPQWLLDEPGIPYVETYAATETATGDDELFLPFSRVLAGGEAGDAGTNACARAAWGPIGSSRPSLPLVIGQCNWMEATDDGNRLMQSPPYSPAPHTSTAVPALEDATGTLRQPSDFVTQIFAKVNGSETTALADKFPCEAELDNPPGAYGPGGFGWLSTCGDDPSQAGCDPATNPCHAPIEGSGASGGPGASLPTSCKDILKDFVGQEVDVPVVTAVSGTGSNLTYTVDGVSTFFFAGYHNVSSADPQDADAYAPKVPAYAEQGCVDASTGDFYKSTCIWGWFTSPVRAAGEIDPDVTARGPVIVQPAG